MRALLIELGGVLMRHLSIAVIAAVSSITATQVSTAADMAVKELPPPPLPALSWSWTGLNAGGGWASADWLNNHLSTCSAGFTVSSCNDGGQSSNSFIGGGQFGAQWQTGQWVVGIEATADYANFHAITLDPQGAATGFTFFSRHFCIVDR